MDLCVLNIWNFWAENRFLDLNASGFRVKSTHVFVHEAPGLLHRKPSLFGGGVKYDADKRSEV